MNCNANDWPGVTVVLGSSALMVLMIVGLAWALNRKS